MKIKRQARVSYKDFCQIFPNRTFTRCKKATEYIVFTEYHDGCFRIEHKARLYFCAVNLVLFPFKLLAVILWDGISSLKYYRFDFSRTARVDYCSEYCPSTEKLLKLVGWV